MTALERVAALERRVAELEAQQATTIGVPFHPVYPTVPQPPPWAPHIGWPAGPYWGYTTTPGAMA